VPFAVYIPTSFPDRLGELWWLALEAVVARNKRVQLLIDGREQGFECASIAEKRHLFEQLYNWLRSFGTEEQLRHAMRDLAGRYRVEISAFCEELCMTWDELATLAGDPLVTIGAHTVNHVRGQRTADRRQRTENKHAGGRGGFQTRPLPVHVISGELLQMSLSVVRPLSSVLRP
jgi:hypothetical protein